MHVLVLESNLLWSSRLRQSLVALGHQATVSAKVPDGSFDLAIVNLGDQAVAEQIAELKGAQVPMIGHAGHKEKELHALGQALGVELLATNSELTFKLPELIATFEPA